MGVGVQQSTRDGGVNKWRKAEGDLIKSGDVVCEVKGDPLSSLN